ncbi:MAG TPA: multifunctional oxoglutarate decarboxylase/oxoglutarate dehydrogenase thiamine pyrophosphate-binding subunit/dihydrolipoyllysine-residue succinyltransferase subunit [Actinomycetota bacterium]
MARDSESFGPNSWLIEEMYQQYLADPDSVGETWKDFFTDYVPRGGEGGAPGTALAPEGAAHGTGVAPEGVAPEGAAPLRGADATIVRHMETSLGIPTATSVRRIPAKLLEVNRSILNRHLARTRGAKVSFTHLIGWAIVRALRDVEGMRVSYSAVGGKPHAVRHPAINLGLAVDVKRDDGSRTLFVPNIKNAGLLDFLGFFTAYEDVIKKVRSNHLTPEDFAGTTHTITNPGMIGTVQSVPRLMAGQAAIVGVGAISYPAEYEGADPRTLADIGVGKVVTLTSTYDHRVIQGAESGEFLKRVHELLLGEDVFYEGIFASMGVPYVPVKWKEDVHPSQDPAELAEKQARVLRLINNYRVRGHLIAWLDPLQAEPPTMHPELDPAEYGLSIWDLDREFVTGGLAGKAKGRLGDVLAILRDAYCRTSTVEYMHIQEPVQKEWIQRRLEGAPVDLAPEDRRRVLRKLNQAEAFERFLDRKFVGHKRFGLEGAESLIPILDVILEGAAAGGIEEVVIGMSHRGRLNVLANTVGKSYGTIFREFEGDIDADAPQGGGDVKYHLGATGTFTSRDGRTMALTVASNPSHLEAVDPVVEGMVRAKQDLLDRGLEFPVLPLLIHGDAAFAGQGVVAETFNLSQLQGYRTGGTVHVIVNNQVGFTTEKAEARSSTYATDVAKMVQAPIFHVNGDDPEACVRIARTALAFRQTFHKDVVIDMVCYRRWGHNEGDDPSMTQPLMYKRIESRRSVRKLYTETLVNRGDLSIEEAEAVLGEFQDELKRAFEETKLPSATPSIEWKPPAPLTGATPEDTAVDRAVLDAILAHVTTVPDGFAAHPRLEKWLRQRASALDEDEVDWSLAEALAFGTLLRDGTTVRLTGEDTRRGTFSQRHAVLVDQVTEADYVPLAALPGAGGKFFTYDSLLSEFAVVGFEYGYSVVHPDALVCWEAQFGDFVNGAQVITDQFLAAAEDKWGQTSRLVLLLPHGYEGQGPEHSSARIERFLSDAAEDNYYVCVPSTPAQLFHLLRRQVRRATAKPAIVTSPKSLLRHPEARSAASAFTDDRFHDVLADARRPDDVRRHLFCTGKVYYDLAAYREANGVRGAAIHRIEQLYPFPADEVRAILESAPAEELSWVQEEPSNFGAARYVHMNMDHRLGRHVDLVTRDESASPATGSLKIHNKQQAALVEAAFAGLKQNGS